MTAPDRYGQRKVPRMYAEINTLRAAIRAEGTPAIQEAWDAVEEHIDFAYSRDPAAALGLPEVKAMVEERDELAFMGRTLQSWTPHDVLVDHEGAFLAISETADRLAALKPDAKG
jgi:hypothetical protein